MATLNDLFPGNKGRLEFIRVLLYVRKPELKAIPRDEELPRHLEVDLRTALQQVRRG